MDKDYTRRYDYARVPKRYRDATLAHVPDSREYKQKLIKWSDHVRETYGTEDDTFGLYLHGVYGTGKTTLAVGAQMWLERNNVSTYFIRFSDLYDTKRENPPWDIQEPPEIDTGIWDYLQKVPVLVVDDVFRQGNEKLGAINAGVLEALIERRLDKNLLHIFTTNVSLEELENGPTERVADLIIGSCYPVEVKEINLRKKLASRRKEL